MRFVIKTLVTAVALWASTALPGITLGGGSIWRKIGTLLVVAVIFGLINAFLKPIIKLLGCGFYILTLGLISFVVNAGLFWLASWIAQKLHLPFHVDGFWAALFGAIIVGLVSFFLHLLIPDRFDERRDDNQAPPAYGA